MGRTGLEDLLGRPLALDESPPTFLRSALQATARWRHSQASEKNLVNHPSFGIWRSARHTLAAMISN